MCYCSRTPRSILKRTHPPILRESNRSQHFRSPITRWGCFLFVYLFFCSAAFIGAIPKHVRLVQPDDALIVQLLSAF